MLALNIVYVTDLLRNTRAFPQALFDLMREPIWQGCGLRVKSLLANDATHGCGKRFDLPHFRALAGACDDDLDGSWHRAYHQLPLAAETYLAGHLPENTLVLGFESAHWLTEFCRARHLPLLDVRPSPLRFARDLYMALRANDAELFQRISEFTVSESELRLEASLLSANVRLQQERLVEAGRYRFELPARSLVFIGQAPSDASLLGPVGIPYSVGDFAERLGHLAADRVLLYKPHPMSAASAELEREALQGITAGPVQLCLQNAYQLLSSHQDVELVGISSGLLQEAVWFDRPAHVLFQPFVPLVAPGAHGPAHHYQQVHFANWSSPGFWHALLTPQRSAPPLAALPSIAHNHARQTFDTWWDYGKVMTWERSLPYESFIRSGGGLLRDRLDTLERRLQPMVEVRPDEDDHWSCCKRWMLARFLAQPEQFGRGTLYQGHEEWGISGQRPTVMRLLRYGLHGVVNRQSRVLEIGCDIGLLGLALSSDIAAYTGLESNPVLVEIASKVAEQRGIGNCQFLARDLQAFAAGNGGLTFDLVCAFAGPQGPAAHPAATLAALVAEHGVLALESGGPQDDGFPARLAAVLRQGFVVLRHGRIQDDGVTPRAFYLLRKQTSGIDA